MDGFSKQISGFYYDQQCRSRELTVTLHPNQILTGETDESDDAPKWGNVKDPDEDTYPEPTAITNSDKSPIVNYKYSKTPIATAIINEDFSIDIANHWSDFGGDAIGGMWNQNRAMGPYLKQTVNFLNSITKTTDDYIKGKSQDKGFNSDLGKNLVTGLKWLAEKVGGSLSEQQKYLSRALVVQGTRFSYYGGTEINMNNLGMKYTIFPTIDGDNNFLTVYDQIKKLLPYVIGDYIPVVIDAGDEVKKAIREFASWQLPPGGFEADLRDVDIVQKGTLKLRLGSFYYIDNLVINGCQLQMSKQMVKNPLVGENSVAAADKKYSPLFCEVSLSFKPASKFSRNSLDRFISGVNAAHKDFAKEADNSLSDQQDVIAAHMSKLNNIK